MLLVHDIGEIDAGDKFVFAQDGWEERNPAELRAIERIVGLAPKATAEFLLNLWKEFNAGETAEARFAKAVDRSMPVLLNLNNGGGSWLENGVSYERVIGRVAPEVESGCPELWSYLRHRWRRHAGKATLRRQHCSSFGDILTSSLHVSVSP
jgi:putative hydrolases of HD superfamily